MYSAVGLPRSLAIDRDTECGCGRRLGPGSRSGGEAASCPALSNVVRRVDYLRKNAKSACTGGAVSLELALRMVCSQPSGELKSCDR